VGSKSEPFRPTCEEYLVLVYEGLYKNSWMDINHTLRTIYETS